MEDYLHIPPGVLVPPLRYSAVEAGLYRGSYPRPLNLPFLATLSLKTIISITPEPLREYAAEWASNSGTRLVHVAPEPSESDSRLSHRQAAVILETMIDATAGPLYVHCLDGTEVTSLAFLALRKLQLWTSAAYFAEMLRFSAIHRSNEAFVAGFANAESDVVVVVPKTKVEWLWRGLLDESGRPKKDMVEGAGDVRVRYEDESTEVLVNGISG